MASFIPTLISLMCRNGLPIMFEVGGYTQDVFGELEPLCIVNTVIPGLPTYRTPEDAVEFFGNILMAQIEEVYRVKNVPDDIVWYGKIIPTICLN